MAEPKFIHLRVHTAYSLSEGAMPVPKLIHRLHDQGVPAIAITDTANLFGGKAFSNMLPMRGLSRFSAASSISAIPILKTCSNLRGGLLNPIKSLFW